MSAHAERKPPRRDRAITFARDRDPGGRLPARALIIFGAWAALLIFAPRDSNFFWAVNGFQSLPAGGRVGLALAVIALGALAAWRPPPGATWILLSLALAGALAFPLREKIHFLGDTALRIHTMAGYGERAIEVAPGELFRGLHATPLDVAINFMFPIAVHHAGPSLLRSLSTLSFLLALLFFAGTWRLVRRLAPDASLRLPLALALVLTGALEAFAGYAESAGLLLALAPWLWAELLAPLRDGREAMRLAAVWCLTILAHRLALVLIVPMLWRAFGPPLSGDRAAGRRLLPLAVVAAVALALAILSATIGSRQIGTDFTDAFAFVRGEGGLLRVHDLLNLVALLAPLALLVPLVAGGAALRAGLGSPAGLLTIVAAAPLIPLALVLPAGPHGFGAHRDWDIAALCGSALTLVAVGVLPAMPPARLRALLLPLLLLLALAAGGWVAVNAHELASLRRALALASKPPRPAAPQLGAIHTYLGQRAMDQDQPGLAAQYYEAAYDFSPNPRFLLLGAEAWAMQGEAAKARRDLDRARASGGLNARGIEAARRLEATIARVESDSARASP